MSTKRSLKEGDQREMIKKEKKRRRGKDGPAQRENKERALREKSERE